MALQEALIQAINEFGKEILVESRLLNILNDYHGFDDTPSARHILKNMQINGDLNLITKQNKADGSLMLRIVTHLNRNYGYDTEQTKKIIQAIITALSSTKCHEDQSTPIIPYCRNNDILNDKDNESVMDLMSNKYEKDDCWIDHFGVIYSQDRRRLIKASKALPEPYTINSKTRIICNEAFSLCHVTSIILPEGVTYIGNKAFSNRFLLKQILLPNSLKYIGDKAFYQCKSLKSIVLPQALIHIGDNPFIGCYNLNDIQCKSPVFEVANGQLYDNESLICFLGNNDTCSINSGISTIRNYAFYFNQFIRTIHLPEGILYIGDRSFSWCSKLDNVLLPTSLKHIGHHAFSFCLNLQYITIPMNVSYIGDHAFDYCSFASINIPSSIEQIGNQALSKCPNMKTIVVPVGTISHIKKLLPDYLQSKLIEQ